MSDDLERRLRGAGSMLAYPETPDLVARVVAALPPGRPRRRQGTPVLVGLAAAVIVILIAVPAPRRAIADLLGWGGVVIDVVDELPDASIVSTAWGNEVSLAEAAATTAFDVLLPGREPDVVFVEGDVPGGLVTLGYRGGTGYRLLITEMLGSIEPTLRKEVPTSARIVPVAIDDALGYWIEGAPHVVLLVDTGEGIDEDRPRLAGNTLVYSVGDVTVRIEIAGTLDQAVAVARSLR